MEKMYSRKEAAEVLGIGLTALDLARTEGKIAYVQYTKNGSVYFTETALQEYIARATHRALPADVNTAPVRRRRRPAAY